MFFYKSYFFDENVVVWLYRMGYKVIFESGMEKVNIMLK